MKVISQQELKYAHELVVLDEAFAAAEKATAEYITKNPGQWYPCGFAWVRINPARGRFVTACKLRNAGSTDEFFGGYTIYNPSGNNTQWMDAKEIGARAFVEVVKKHFPDLKIRAQTRID